MLFGLCVGFACVCGLGEGGTHGLLGSCLETRGLSLSRACSHVGSRILGVVGGGGGLLLRDRMLLASSACPASL